MARLSSSLTLKVRPHYGQKAVLDSTAFCTAAIAGTGGGKTVGGMVWLGIRMVQRPGLIWVVAEPTNDMVDRILLTPAPGKLTLPEFLGKFDPHQVFLRSKGIIRNRYGTVVLASGERPASLQGTQVGGIWLDEAGLMRREAFLTAVQRVGFYEGDLLITTTPYNMGWLKLDVYDAYMDGDPDFNVINFPSTANPTYPKASVERARRTMSAARFKMLYEGVFGRPEGMIYDCWDDETCVVDDFEVPESWERFGGIDFGWNHPTAGVFLARDEDGVYYWVGEHRERETTMGVHASMLRARGGGEFPWVGDPAGAQQMAELRRGGIAVNGGDNDVLAGIDTVYSLIASGRLKVFRSCKFGRDELAGYVWEGGKSGFKDKPVKERDDLMDALRYVVQHAEKSGRLRLHV